MTLESYTVAVDRPRKYNANARTLRVVTFLPPLDADLDEAKLPWRVQRNDATFMPDGTLRIDGPEGTIPCPVAATPDPADLTRLARLVEICRSVVGSWR